MGRGSSKVIEFETMTSLLFPKYHFPLFLISICPRCNHEEEVEKLGDLDNLYTCKECGYYISRADEMVDPLAGMEYLLLEIDKNNFLEEHEKIIIKALDLNSTFNSFGKRKIDYSTFIPELLEFFEDNFESPKKTEWNDDFNPEEYRFGDLKFRASISKEGVDELANMLEAKNKDERN